MEERLAQLQAIVDFRKSHPAPVDDMGCYAQGMAQNEAERRFEILVALMMSSMTKDQQTHQAMKNLRSLKGGCTAANLAAMSEGDLDEAIRCVGFHKTKAKNIKTVAGICLKAYDGDIPRQYEEILAFPGVGVKMATLAMDHCWNEATGIGCDIHVHRISNRLGWVSTKSPDKTEIALQKAFPKEVWGTINGALVGFGQLVCKSTPNCEGCPVSASCPSSLI